MYLIHTRCCIHYKLYTYLWESTTKGEIIGRERETPPPVLGCPRLRQQRTDQSTPRARPSYLVPLSSRFRLPLPPLLTAGTGAGGQRTSEAVGGHPHLEVAAVEAVGAAVQGELAGEVDRQEREPDPHPGQPHGRCA